MTGKILTYLSEKKAFVFLVVCLFVHAFNVALFLAIGCMPLVVLNCASTLYYATVVLLLRKYSEFYIIFTYLEILVFSFLSELFVGGLFSYIFFVIGMISVIMYLLPANKRRKFFFQGIGVVFAIGIFYVQAKQHALFPQFRAVSEPYKYKIGFLNLGITLFTLFYVSTLYFFELNRANEKLAYTSNHDLLTGLFNRRFFEYIMKRHKAEDESEYTIALFDIDDFKKINDSYGHQAGDYVLKEVSHIIGDCPYNEYIAVRWGGEEFILFMPQTDESAAYAYLTELCRKISSSTFVFDAKRINVTLTVGMCTGTDFGTYEAVVRTADDRLYYGKRNGKNCVVKSTPDEPLQPVK